MSLFEISEREFMNGKDKNHVYRILYKLEEQRQKLIDEEQIRKLNFLDIMFCNFCKIFN